MEDYLQTTGRIFDIQRYSIHDGNGIRTIVFLKGCGLRCRWCCNPESQEYQIQTMSVQGKDKVIGRDVTVAEVMGTVQKDRAYYRQTGGGLTLSGGEMLNQPGFAAALLRAAKEAGITTAVETTGRAGWETIAPMLPLTDQWLMDIKHMDADKHREYTGDSNRLMLENAGRIAASGLTELSIRVPVIPGFNDTVAEIAAIGAFAGTLKQAAEGKAPGRERMGLEVCRRGHSRSEVFGQEGHGLQIPGREYSGRGQGGVRRLHLLPYHRLGQDKYAGLGREYRMGDVLPPANEKMQELLEAVRLASGLECQIGG